MAAHSNTNVNIVLGFFKPIVVSFDDSDDSFASQTETGIHSFVNQYGIEGASDILNSISDYPSDKILELKHTFELELEYTTDKTYEELLRDQIAKLKKQKVDRMEFYKQHLISIVLESPELSDMTVQRKNLSEMLTVGQLVNIVLEMKSFFNLLEEKKSLQKLLLPDTFEKRFRKIYKKKYREIVWYCAEKLSKIEAGKGCVICYEPRKYMIVDCGHYCLCDGEKCVKEERCPICRTAVTKLVRVFG